MEDSRNDIDELDAEFLKFSQINQSQQQPVFFLGKTCEVFPVDLVPIADLLWPSHG